MAILLDLPYQLLIDGVLCQLDVQSLLNLRQVSHTLQQLADDELVWRRKLAEDFNFPIRNSARASGWQKLYKGLLNPGLYTWGAYSHNRIGRTLTADTLPTNVWNIITRTRGVPFPLAIDWRHAQQHRDAADSSESDSDEPDSHPIDRGDLGISPDRMGIPVQLHAGGWSFYALTGEGQILAWGSPNELGFRRGRNTTFEEPTFFDMHGKRATSLTGGRQHLVAMLNDGRIMEWSHTWDKPIYIDIQHNFGHASSDDFNIVQVEAGWTNTAALIDYGSGDSKSEREPAKREQSIVFWSTAWSSIWRDSHLRPELRRRGNGRWSPPSAAVYTVTAPSLPSRATKVAAGEDFLLVLTEDNSVYYLDIPRLSLRLEDRMHSLLGEPLVEGTREERWRQLQQTIREAVAYYAERTRQGAMSWRKLDTFCSDLHSAGGLPDGGNVWEQEELEHLITPHTKVTHVSAQFRNFAVYAPEAGVDYSDKGKGLVILGHKDNVGRASVIPELQGIQVIKVSHGDYHSAALTQDGRVFTWGQRSDGALGAWDSYDVPSFAPSTLNGSGPSVTTPFRLGRAAGLFGPIRSAQAAELQQQAMQVAESASSMVDAEKDRYKLRQMPDKIDKPLPVRFGFPRLGEKRKGITVQANDTSETQFAFDIALAGWHSGALTIDRALVDDGPAAL